METPEVRYARNGDIALAFQVLGEGPIDLVFVPGFIGNLDLMWEFPPYARFLRRMASFSRLIVMDRRGTGLSDRLSPEDVPPLEVLMDDLHALLDEVGSERAALFGCFDSGALCALFAATFPDRTTALALFAPAVVGAATRDFAWAWSEAAWSSYIWTSWRADGEPARTQRRSSHSSTPRSRTTTVPSAGGRGSCDKPRARTPW